MPVKIIVCFLVGYLFGNIQTAFFIGKAHGIDIRRYGSGNAGTTNAMRTLGRKSGSLVFLGDLLKVLVPGMILRYAVYPGEPYVILLCEILGFGAVIGHCFPFWMQFKGGKGIAVTSAAMLCVDYRLIVFVIVFALILYVTRYVSVGSLFVVVLFPTYMLIMYRDHEYWLWMVLVALLYTISGVYMHRANIARLLNGTENKIGQHVKVEEAVVHDTAEHTDTDPDSSAEADSND